MSETTYPVAELDDEKPTEELEQTIGGMPVELLQGSEPRQPRGEDRLTSSGEGPTGGTPVGGATDRIIPDRTLPRTAENVEPHRDMARPSNL